MIKNTYISLLPSSAYRMDALNSLKHTLLLNYEIPQVNDKSRLVSEVMVSCQKCCQGLFIDRINSSNEKIYFNFFGNLPSSDEKTLKKTFHQLSFLDEYPPNKTKYPGIKEVGFPTMILDHCVLSCYHAVLTDLMDHKTVTSYEIINDIYSREMHSQGIHSLYTKGLLTFDSEPRLKKRASSYNVNSKKSALASDFGKKAQSHLKKLSSAESLFKEANTANTSGFYLQFADVFSHICDIDVRTWNFFSSKINDKDKPNILEQFESLSNNLFLEDYKNSRDIVDKIYLHYITERISGFKLTAFLLKNIFYISKKTSYALCQNDLLDILCLSYKLPNIFSRQYFLQYAFDKLINQPISYQDFWHDHRLDMSTSVYESPLKTAKSFQFVRWQEQFYLFCNYMSAYVIPLYEWCFTNMLMDTIEQLNLNAANAHMKTTDEASKHRTNLLTAYNVLSEYIRQNHKQIIDPVPFRKNPGTLCFTTKSTDIKYLDLPTAALQTFFQSCFPQEELDLNLSQINPEFFLRGRTNYKDDNFKLIKHFYINLLYPG